jgi:4'-phosphopantetheinyl transferase
MPLYKTITVNPTTKVLIWKIEESFVELSEGIDLTAHCRDRVNSMKSDLHRRGFMSVRHLLAIEGYTDHDLYYDVNGKPHLTDNNFISITHSFIFAAIIISNRDVGIDIEKKRHKILRIAHKFTPVIEYKDLANDYERIRKMTLVWCAKESLYKSFANPGVSFIQNIYVENFELYKVETDAKVEFNGTSVLFHVHFLEFEEFSCAYALLQ